MLAGVMLTLLLSAPFTAYRIKSTLTASRDATNRIMKSIAGVNALNYGLVEAMSADGAYLTVSLYNPFSGPTRQVRVRIEPSAYIAFQELRGSGSVYDTLSEPRKAALSELRQGDRVALFLARDASGALRTNYILFGDPL
jgi:hypothetical protein